ncbi:flippase [Vibrio cholerae]|nr:flippase [Vibrio cholerae]
MKKILVNSMASVVGVILPAIIMLPFFGYFSRLLPVEQFGIFTICFAILGYSGLFDAGLSRAVVRTLTIREKLRLSEGDILGTALAFSAILSSFASLILYLNADSICNLLSISYNLKIHAVASIEYLSLAITPMILSLVLLSKLEAQQDFVTFNKIKLINSILSVIPCLVLAQFINPMEGAILGIVLGRIFSFINTIFHIKDSISITGFGFSKPSAKALFSFGGWITVSNFVSPIMVYFDRFILSSMLGADKVAFYSMPSELITKINFLPVSIVRVFFPLLSGIESYNRNSFEVVYKKLVLFFVVSMFFGVASLLFFSEDIIRIWLGQSYVEVAAKVMQILLIGYFFNGLSQLPVLYMQSQGNSKSIAILHLFEVVPYLTALYFFIDLFGIYGAAYAWCLRVIFDNFALVYIAHIRKSKSKFILSRYDF